MLNVALFQHADNLQSFAAGQHVFDEGEPGGVMYAVVEGEVEILVKGHSVEIVGPGGIVGEMAIISAQPRSATVRARVDCKLAPVDEKRFSFMVQQTPFFAIQVMRIMAERLRSSHTWIVPSDKPESI